MKELLIVCLGLLVRQVFAPQKQPNNEDPVSRYLFSPEVVLQYQEEIGLTDKQREAIMTAVHELQDAAPQAKEQFEAKLEKAIDLLKKEHIDEQAVLAELEKVQQQ